MTARRSRCAVLFVIGVVGTATVAGLVWMPEATNGVSAQHPLTGPPVVVGSHGRVPLTPVVLDDVVVVIDGDTVLTVDDVVSGVTSQCRSNDSDPAVAAKAFAPGLPDVNPEGDFTEDQTIDVQVRITRPSGEIYTTWAVSSRLLAVAGGGYLRVTVTLDQGLPTIGTLGLIRRDGGDWSWIGGSLPEVPLYLGSFGQGRQLVCEQPTDLVPDPGPEPTMPRTL